jgi:hypothetical protein
MINTILSSGEVGNIGLKHLKEARELTSKKWEKFGLLKGLEGAMKENVATLYENQAHHMLYESTTSDGTGSFETVAFPVIRRTFAKLLANEVVSIQAMSMAVGRLYFFNPKISKRVNGAHSELDGAYSNGADHYTLDAEGRKTLEGGAAYARLVKPTGTQYETFSLYDAQYATDYDGYGNALFNRTMGDELPFTGATTVVGAYTGVEGKVKVKITGFSIDGRGRLRGPIGIPSDTEEFLSSLTITCTKDLNLDGAVAIAAGKTLEFRILPQQYGHPIVDKDGAITVEIDLTASNSAGAYVAMTPASAGAVFNFSYKVYADLEGEAEMAEISFDFDHIDVSVQERKLRASFTPEVQQDVQAFQSVDVEAELSALLSETVSAEIDREILRDLRQGAAWLKKWDAAGYDKQLANGTAVGITRKDYNQGLITVINQISARIHKTTLRGGANWIIVSTEVSALLNDLEYFHVTDASPEETKYSLGIEKTGAIQNRFQVYVDVYAPANTVLIGHKGDGIFHAGYIYAPYVPLMLFPAQRSHQDFRTVMGIMTRYAKKMVNNRFYGKVLVSGLEWSSPSEFNGIA